MTLYLTTPVLVAVLLVRNWRQDPRNGGHPVAGRAEVALPAPVRIGLWAERALRRAEARLRA